MIQHMRSGGSCSVSVLSRDTVTRCAIIIIKMSTSTDSDSEHGENVSLKTIPSHFTTLNRSFPHVGTNVGAAVGRRSLQHDYYLFYLI